jgi:hypothetical protein
MASKTRSVKSAVTGPASRSRRHLLQAALSLALAPAVVSSLGSSPAAAASGRIEFRVVRGGFVLGFSSGSGSLFFEGDRYPLKIGGVSLGATIGLASADFVGRVRKLRRARDVEGTYRAIGAGLAAAGGGAVARLRNSRGVELEISGKQIGFKASVDLSGLRVRLAR